MIWSKLKVVPRSLALALAASILGTVMHQTSLNGLPFGSFLALTLVLTIAANLRKVKLAGWWFFVGLAASIFYIGLDIHEDKMIPANLSGYLWSYGSITIAAFVAMFPRFKKR